MFFCMYTTQLMSASSFKHACDSLTDSTDNEAVSIGCSCATAVSKPQCNSFTLSDLCNITGISLVPLKATTT